ncbi:MAG: HEPN domain-containing protein [Phycisphaerae bacterium]|nr:HEPN domain-containing protein [Phycisphaerae bacterium]
MPNKSLAEQWLVKAWHDLKSAQILYDAGHFTDSIGCDCQQAIEKMLKSFLAYENKKIKRTHDLAKTPLVLSKTLGMQKTPAQKCISSMAVFARPA